MSATNTATATEQTDSAALTRTGPTAVLKVEEIRGRRRRVGQWLVQQRTEV